MFWGRVKTARAFKGGMTMALDPTALFTLSYGLYVLTAREGGRDLGCIVNTVTQLTENPTRIAVSVNKQNFTNEVIQRTGVFNVSVLTEAAPMDLFRHFGFQSGRDVDKFAGRTDPVSENGLRYISGPANALISGKVEQAIDCGTHMLYIALVTEARKLSDAPSMTYAYYFANVKPRPQPKPAQEKPRRGFVCRICGYFYEGDELPPDFICPLCKHGAADFEPVGF
ncbi:MAG TPA: flavin reductase [Candidatus Limiplasma pullistercoris]|nr:flavin reductase [Candidatus Limiplasma pullistercoris]